MFVPLLLLLLFCGVEAQPDRVLLRDVQTLVLTRGLKTTGRRSSPVPQIKCVGSVCPRIDPHSVVCEQLRGVNYVTSDPNWKCTGTLIDGLKFDKTDVSCEGYAYTNDPYILAGSCGLEYTTVGGGGARPAPKAGDSIVFGMIIVVCFVFMVCGFVFCMCVDDPFVLPAPRHIRHTQFCPTCHNDVPMHHVCQNNPYWCERCDRAVQSRNHYCTPVARTHVHVVQAQEVTPPSTSTGYGTTTRRAESQEAARMIPETSTGYGTTTRRAEAPQEATRVDAVTAEAATASTGYGTTTRRPETNPDPPPTPPTSSSSSFRSKSSSGFGSTRRR